MIWGDQVAKFLFGFDTTPVNIKMTIHEVHPCFKFMYDDVHACGSIALGYEFMDNTTGLRFVDQRLHIRGHINKSAITKDIIINRATGEFTIRYYGCDYDPLLGHLDPEVLEKLDDMLLSGKVFENLPLITSTLDGLIADCDEIYFMTADDKLLTV